MMIEPKMVSYEDFPVSALTTAGMKTLRADPIKAVNCIDNIVFAERDGMKLTLQILVSMDPSEMEELGFFPVNSSVKPRPFIVYVQGSAWLPQALFINVPQLAEFARRGFVVVIAQYRPSTVAPFPAQIVDIKSAVRFMKKHACEYGVDPDQCVLWGDSSGGHTAVMAGITGDDILPCPDDPGISVSVRAIVDYFCPTDLSKMCEEPSTMDHTLPNSPEGMVLGNVNVLEHPEQVAAACPMTYITKERAIPPMLIIHGNKDRIVPFGQSIMLFEKLRECGKNVDFYRLEGADHGSGEFWSNPVFDLTEAFIRKNL